MTIKTNSDSFFTLIVEAISQKEAYVQVYWTWAFHPGEAIDKIKSHLETESLDAFRIAEIDYYNYENLPDNTEEINENGIFTTNDSYGFSLDEYTKFNLPCGVILATEEGDCFIEEMEEAYSINKDDNDLWNLNAVIDDSHLLEYYFELVNTLPSIKVVWISLLAEYDGDYPTIDFYANESLNSISAATHYLSSNLFNLVKNGYVGITVYSQEGATNLNISEHKKIEVLTKSEEIIRNCEEAINHKIERIDDREKLIEIDRGFYHYHYRTAKSLNRQELIEYLQSDGFKLWKSEET